MGNNDMTFLSQYDRKVFLQNVLTLIKLSLLIVKEYIARTIVEKSIKKAYPVKPITIWKGMLNTNANFLYLLNSNPIIDIDSIKNVKYIGIQWNAVLFSCPIIDAIGLYNSTAQLTLGLKKSLFNLW
mgnify:CR=1 FL=1